MEDDITPEELGNTMKSKAVKDTAPGPDGIPCSVYVKLLRQPERSFFPLIKVIPQFFIKVISLNIRELYFHTLL